MGVGLLGYGNTWTSIQKNYKHFSFLIASLELKLN